MHNHNLSRNFVIPHEHEQNSVSFFILNEITQISNSISVSNPQVSNRQTLANQGKELCPIADRDRLFHWVNTEPLTYKKRRFSCKAPKLCLSFYIEGVIWSHMYKQFKNSCRTLQICCCYFS